ncbi:MAG: hypothetical protein JOY88_16005 [Pelomonas sp.]|nr:hypothetical protein [Roseateles sp.]
MDGLPAGAAPLRANLGLACEPPVAGLHAGAPPPSAELPEPARRLPLGRELSVGLPCHANAAGALVTLREARGLRGGRHWIAALPRTEIAGTRGLGAIKRPRWRDVAALARSATPALALL